MKIIAGKYRGLKLEVKSSTIAPTKSMVKEALFNILVHSYHNFLVGAVALDLFCGTGALGLEALSRGAKKVIMVDKDTSDIQWNLSRIGHLLGIENIQVIQSDVLKLPKSSVNCNLVMLDPPYCNTGVVNKVLTRLMMYNWISKETLIVLEMSSKENVNNIDSRFGLIELRKYGLSQILFLNMVDRYEN